MPDESATDLLADTSVSQEQAGQEQTSERRTQLLEAKKKALDVLSRREHTRLEISEKLAKYEYQDGIVDAVLEYLQTKNYQCDRRFAFAFAEQRAARGHGPHSIKASLSQRGVSSDDARDALENVSHNWTTLAVSVLRKKIPTGKTLSSERATAYKEKAKYARFLQSRGFSSAQINVALETLGTSTSEDDTG